MYILHFELYLLTMDLQTLKGVNLFKVSKIVYLKM